MPTIPLTLSASMLQIAVDAICDRHGYAPFLDVNGIQTPNPQSRQEFMRQYVISVLKHEVREHRHATALAAVPQPPELEIT